MVYEATGERISGAANLAVSPAAPNHLALANLESNFLSYCGSRIIYRLGVTIQNDSEYHFDTDPPLNMANYCDASNGPFGMFEAAELPAKPYYAFLAFLEMLDHTPN